MNKIKKIEIGYTNESYKQDNIFFQIKKKNGLNHKSDYKQLKNFDFVPKLIEDNDEYSKWEWIDGKHLDINPSKNDLEQLAQILLKLHNSNVKFTKSNIRKRIETYRKIIKQKNIKIEIIEKLYRKINVILKNIDKTKPIHGDLYKVNMIKTKENKIYLVDWEYSHMGDIHFELAYIIEAFNLDSEKEKIFLEAYNNYDSYILKKHKILVNYITILWLYSQDKLFFSPEHCIKRLENLAEKN